MSASAAIRQFLFEAQQRVPCHAVAFTPPSRDHFDFHCTAADAAEVRRILESVADSFLLECRNRPEPVVSNRVRYEANGPLVGRFLAVAIQDEKSQLAGVALIFRTMEQKAFSKEDARTVGQLTHQLSKVIALPADPMTGLLTRSGVEKLIEWRLGSRGARTASTVLYGDIDQLHVVNDLLGFEAGDQVIAAVAHALQAQLASRDAVLSRLSGDRFTIFFSDCPLDRARAIGDELRDAVQCSAAHDRQPTRFRSRSPSAPRRCAAASAASITRWPPPRSPARPRRIAAAIASSRTRCTIRASTAASTTSRSSAGCAARSTKGNFQIFGQPIAALLQPEKVRRYEALLRLIDEKGRLVLPGQFMSSATRYQLLPQIDRCVISDVLTRLAAAKREPGFEPIHLSINLSGPTLSDPTFLDWLVVQIDSSGVPGDWLEFELTETAAVSNLEHAQRLMARLGGMRLPLRARRLRHRPELARASEGAQLLGAEDRRLVHPRHPAQRALGLAGARGDAAGARHGHGDRRGIRRDAGDLHAPDRARRAVRPGLCDRPSAAAGQDPAAGPAARERELEEVRLKPDPQPPSRNRGSGFSLTRGTLGPARPLNTSIQGSAAMETQPRSATRPARGFTQRLKEDGRRTLEQRKRSAAERVEEIAQAIERTGAQFSENEPTLADVATRLAATVGNLATRLREGSIDDLVDDTRAFARRNPGLFLAGGVVAGLVLARFVKASARRAPTLTEEVDEAVDDAIDEVIVEVDEEVVARPGA